VIKASLVVTPQTFETVVGQEVFLVVGQSYTVTVLLEPDPEEVPEEPEDPELPVEEPELPEDEPLPEVAVTSDGQDPLK